MSVPHVVLFAQEFFMPLFVEAAAIIFGIITIAALVVVFVRAFSERF